MSFATEYPDEDLFQQHLYGRMAADELSNFPETEDQNELLRKAAMAQMAIGGRTAEEEILGRKAGGRYDKSDFLDAADAVESLNQQDALQRREYLTREAIQEADPKVRQMRALEGQIASLQKNFQGPLTPEGMIAKGRFTNQLEAIERFDADNPPDEVRMGLREQLLKRTKWSDTFAVPQPSTQEKIDEKIGKLPTGQLAQVVTRSGQERIEILDPPEEQEQVAGEPLGNSFGPAMSGVPVGWGAMGAVGGAPDGGGQPGAAPRFLGPDEVPPEAMEALQAEAAQRREAARARKEQRRQERINPLVEKRLKNDPEEIQPFPEKEFRQAIEDGESWDALMESRGLDPDRNFDPTRASSAQWQDWMNSPDGLGRVEEAAVIRDWAKGQGLTGIYRGAQQRLESLRPPAAEDNRIPSLLEIRGTQQTRRYFPETQEQAERLRKAQDEAEERENFRTFKGMIFQKDYEKRGKQWVPVWKKIGEAKDEAEEQAERFWKAYPDIKKNLVDARENDKPVTDAEVMEEYLNRAEAVKKLPEMMWQRARAASKGISPAGLNAVNEMLDTWEAAPQQLNEQPDGWETYLRFAAIAGRKPKLSPPQSGQPQATQAQPPQQPPPLPATPPPVPAAQPQAEAPAKPGFLRRLFGGSAPPAIQPSPSPTVQPKPPSLTGDPNLDLAMETAGMAGGVAGPKPPRGPTPVDVQAARDVLRTMRATYGDKIPPDKVGIFNAAREIIRQYGQK